jgi:hypothetical protein
MPGLILFPDLPDPLLNVTFSVGGRFSPNQPNDVLLVQALLNTIILFDPDGTITGSRFQKQVVKLTGSAGPKTKTLILQYQREVQRRPKPDGIVSRCTGGSEVAVAALDFTIISLCVNVRELLRRIPALGTTSLVDFITSHVPELAGALVPRAEDGFILGGGESLPGEVFTSGN